MNELEALRYRCEELRKVIRDEINENFALQTKIQEIEDILKERAEDSIDRALKVLSWMEEHGVEGKGTPHAMYYEDILLQGSPKEIIDIINDRLISYGEEESFPAIQKELSKDLTKRLKILVYKDGTRYVFVDNY